MKKPRYVYSRSMMTASVPPTLKSKRSRRKRPKGLIR